MDSRDCKPHTKRTFYPKFDVIQKNIAIAIAIIATILQKKYK